MSARLAPYLAVHESPAGAGDKRPTANQIVKDLKLTNAWTGKKVLVTGCSAGGIGPATAEAFALTGADVFITARNGKGQDVLEQIQATKPKGTVSLLSLDLDSLDNVRAFAQEFKSKHSTLNVLVCNAGIMAPQELMRTADGHEVQFGVNFLAHFLLFQLLKDNLLAGSSPELPSKVVLVSSMGHKSSPPLYNDYGFNDASNPYSPWKGYGQSKTAMVYMGTEIERLYGKKPNGGIHAWSLHPGGIWTPLQKHQPGIVAANKDNPEVQKIIKSLEQGAATTVWAATEPRLLENGKGGLYLEDCAEALPGTGIRIGYADWAYDVEGARTVWADACKMVGVADDFTEP